MGILNIKAKLECDGCGSPFSVELDAADNMRDHTLSDLVDDVIRGEPSISVQGDHRLCVKCTLIVDNAFDDDAQPSFEEVKTALDQAADRLATQEGGRADAE